MMEESHIKTLKSALPPVCLHEHAPAYWSTAGITSHPWQSSHWWVFDSVSHPTETEFVALQICVCVLSYLWRVWEERRRNQSNAATKKEGNDTKNNVLSLSVFVCIPRSLTHAVVSTMITERWWQTSASQKLASRQREHKQLCTSTVHFSLFIERSSF